MTGFLVALAGHRFVLLPVGAWIGVQVRDRQRRPEGRLDALAARLAAPPAALLIDGGIVASKVARGERAVRALAARLWATAPGDEDIAVLEGRTSRQLRTELHRKA